VDPSKIFTCINCPLGCAVTVAPGGGGLTAAGHSCRRGKKYALQEYRDPRRVLTGTVRVDGGFLPRLPVKTDRPITREAIPAAALALAQISVRAPVHCGDRIASDLAGSGANLVATRDLEAQP
jgi:CxxC motif-containing protein